MRRWEIGAAATCRSRLALSSILVGFGFVLWESDKAKGGRGNEKREKDGDERSSAGTKQDISDQVTSMGPTNSMKIIE